MSGMLAVPGKWIEERSPPHDTHVTPTVPADLDQTHNANVEHACLRVYGPDCKCPTPKDCFCNGIDRSVFTIQCLIRINRRLYTFVYIFSVGG